MMAHSSLWTGNGALPEGGGAHRPRAPAGRARWVTLLLALLPAVLLAALLGGCAAMWVGSHDKEAVERTSEISRSVLKLYQDLLATAPAQRAAAVAGPLGARQGDVETQIRLHLLREQARPKNAESAKIAENLLESWQKFSASHRAGEASALSDVVLGIERGILERHLRAAFVAEEAKKLGGGSGS